MSNAKPSRYAASIVYVDGDRRIVDTRVPHGSLMNDAARPFAVIEVIGPFRRVATKGRYATLANAKRALRYLK